jgi:hypothetical protein
MTVCNQHQGMRLVSPICFLNRGKYYKYRVERTNTDVMMKCDLKFDFDQDTLEGILMYEMQREENTRSNHQSSINTTYAEVIEEASKMTRLLVAWKIDRSGESKVRIILVECDDSLVLNEDKLAQLHKKANNIPSSYHSRTWLMYDNTVLKATYEIEQKTDIDLKITISEENEDENTKSALWIDPERQVSFLMVIHSMLIYIVSLMFQSTIDMTIYNSCTNIELTSPVYFIQDTMCRIQFPQQVNSNNIIKIKFATGIDRDTFGGALLYNLQRECGTISAQLLVIWGYKSCGIYSHAWIIKHESTLIWDKNKLKRFHDVYNSRRDEYLNIGRWGLDNNTELRTECVTSHGGFAIAVIIFEGSRRGIFYTTPRVDPNR